jgi:TonB family protein
MFDNRIRQLIIAALIYVGAVSSAAAQNYVFSLDNAGVAATPLEQANPVFPSKGLRSGQEGWVSMSFVVTPDGRAIDPVVIDATGGVTFEQSARDVVSKWRFEAPASQLANNIVDIRFEIYRGRDMATSNFMRRYRRIMTHLHNEEPEDARTQVDSANELGGWNLYESTMLCLMLGRVDGAEGNTTGKLENYRRARGVSNRRSLDGEDRRDLLAKMFGLQYERGQYAAAQRTLALLKKEIGSKEAVAELQEQAAELDRRLGGMDPIVANGTLYNPCNCDAGVPLWSYQPVRRTFSFASLSGNVERFEARCDRDRLQRPVEANKRWTLPEDAGSCRVFVFGDDGASFDFVEHQDAEPDLVSEPAVVARSDVLD